MNLRTPTLDSTEKDTPDKLETTREFIITEQDPTTLPLASLYYRSSSELGSVLPGLIMLLRVKLKAAVVVVAANSPVAVTVFPLELQLTVLAAFEQDE